MAMRKPSAAPALIASGLAFSAMVLCAKKASLHLPGAEVALLRFVVGLLACAVAATRVRFRAHSWRGLFFRGAFGGVAVLLYFQTVEHLAVGLATLLNYTSPVFLTLWATLFLREPLTRRTLGALALTSAGVALVIYGQAPPGSLGFGRWQLAGLASAALSGAATTVIREVRRSDGPWEIFAAFCVVGALITLPPAARAWVQPSPGEWGLLLLLGGFSVAAQLGMTWSLRYLPAATAGVIMQLTPVTSILAGVVLFHDPLAGLVLLGATLTLLGVTWGVLQSGG
jgi:drug/metabolite transporter (DMT)-like permease